MNFLKISPSVHFVLCTRPVSPLLRIMTRVRYYLCPVSQLSYIMNVAAVLHLCSRSQPDLDTPQLYLVMLFTFNMVAYLPPETKKTYLRQNRNLPHAGAGDGAGSWCYLAAPGPAPPTPASPPSSIFIGLSPRGNKHNLAQDHYTFASAVHCVNNTVNQLVGDTLLFILNH